MQVRLSGVKRRRDGGGGRLVQQLLELPSRSLRNFRTQLREVSLRLETSSRGDEEGHACAVVVRPVRGELLHASGAGADPETAARRAMTHARRLLRRRSDRRVTERVRLAAS